MKNLLTIAEVSEKTGLTKKAVKSRCDRGTIKFQRGETGQRLIPQEEVERLLNEKPFSSAPKKSAEINEDSAVVTGEGSLNDPDKLLGERGLNPEDWDITHLKVNEWDGPNGELQKQLTVNVKKKLSKLLVQPASFPDEYIAPPKKVKKSTDGELVVFVGDQQAPHHDETLHSLFLNWLDTNSPDRGVLMGDTVDFPDISRHAANPEWDSSVQECVDAGYLILRDYVKASEDTSWVKLMGNHDERIRNKLLAHVASLYDVRRADDGSGGEPPIWCISHLLRLKQLGIDFIAPNGGYSHAQAKVTNHLAARHGWLAKKGAGASALATLEQLGYSVVVGHTHRQSLVHKTTHDIDGTISTHAAAETGCMCKVADGLGYTVAPDWQNGFATAQVWNDGTFKIDLATYANGVLYWRNQRFTI